MGRLRPRRGRGYTVRRAAFAFILTPVAAWHCDSCRRLDMCCARSEFTGKGGNIVSLNLWRRIRALPKGWRVHQGRDPEKELRLLQRRFRSIRRHHDCAIKLRHFYRSAKVPVLVAMGISILISGLMSLSPFPPMVLLKHLAAFPNCDAARALGLAPSNKGEPGYWPQHDEDRDGKACELWRH